jgi:RND family efflux transporter MFP subunit
MLANWKSKWTSLGKKRKGWILGLTAIVVILAAGTLWAQNRGSGIAMPGATMLRSVTVSKSTFQETITGSGSIQAIDKAILNARVMGTLSQVLVEDEQMVEKDQLLFTIASPQTEAALEQAKYNYAVAKQNYDKLAMENQNGSIDLRDASLLVAQTKTAYQTAIENQGNLVVKADATGTVTDLPLMVGESFTVGTPLAYVGDDNGGVEVENEILLQKARYNLEQAQKAVDALQIIADYDGVVLDIPVSVGEDVVNGQQLLKLDEPERDRSDSASYALRLSQAEVNLANRKNALESLEIRATISGRISDLGIKVGDSISQQTIIAILGDNRFMEVEVMVPQNQINGIAIGNLANLTINAVNTSYTGKVASISSVWSTVNGVVSYPVTIALDVEDEKLTVGMSVIASITSSGENVSSAYGLRGNLKSSTQKTITPKVTGTVVSIEIENGQWLNEGDLLAVLKNDDLVVAYQQALKDLQDVRATTVTAKSSAVVSRVLISKGDQVEKGQLLMTLRSHLAEANLKQAEKEFQDLYVKGNHRYSAKVSGKIQEIHVQIGQRVAAGDLLLTLQNGDVVVAKDKAAANYQSAQAAYSAIMVNPEAGALAKAWVSLVQAEANLADAERNYGYLTVEAPLTGKVFVRPNFEAGDQVLTDSQLAAVYDMSIMQLVVNIDEIDVAKIEIGMACKVTLDALPDRVYGGVVHRISQEGTAKDGVATYAITVNVPKPTLIKTAMTATADIVIFTMEDTIAIPKSALQAGGDTAEQKMVYLLNDRGGLEERNVKVGRTTETMAVILEGLQEGEKVITTKIGRIQ